MRTHLRSLLVACGLCLPAAALAQPASTDLGTVVLGTPIVTSVGATPGGAVQWFKFTTTVPISQATLRNMEITYTVGDANPSADGEISLYNAAGNLVNFDDDDGVGATSRLTLGTGDGALVETIGNGRDGDLPAGTYYLAIGHFSSTQAATNWGVTPSATGLNATTLTISAADTTPTAPSSFIDLGTLAAGGTLDRAAGDTLAAGEVKWYKVVLPAAPQGISVAYNSLANPISFVDIDTQGETMPASGSSIVLYGSNGAIQTVSGVPSGTTTDRATKTGSNSRISFGQTSPSRPAQGTGSTFAGAQGHLRPGTYYIGIAGPGTAPSATAASGTNFGVVSTSTNTGGIQLHLRSGSGNFNPSGSGSVSPSSNGVNETSVLRVQVIPGTNPTVAISTVSVNASAVGAGTIALLDNGVAPDNVAGDAVYSANVTIDSGTGLGAKTLPFTITDVNARTGTGNITLTVVGPTNPTASGTATPNVRQIGETSLLRVTVNPGLHPPSTGIDVTVDASSINAGTVTLLNDGNSPDASSTDNIWSANVTVGAGTTNGPKTLPITVTDDEARTAAAASIAMTISGPPPSCPAGNETFPHTNLISNGLAGGATNGVATFTPTGSYNVASVHISGRFIPTGTGTLVTEARVRVTNSAALFGDAQPFPGQTTTLGAEYDVVDMVVPVSPCGGWGAANAGQWELRVFETFDDGGATVDGTWSNLCVALVEGTVSDPTAFSDDVCVGDVGDVPSNAAEPSGTGALTKLNGTIANTTDADMYLVNICDMSTFSATTAPAPTDTQLWLFNLDGTGVMFNDDDVAIAGPSTINNSGGQITANGNYYLAISPYNRDPQDVASALLWNNTGPGGTFTGIRAPDGPAAANPIDHWSGTSNPTTPFNYSIVMTGVCFPAGTPVGCNLADITEIGGTTENPGNPDGQLTVDDIIVFINAFSDSVGCPGANPPNGPACNVSDVTGIGGPPELPDGQLTVDDIIAFFNAFSDGCV